MFVSMVIINPCKLASMINHHKCGFRHPSATPLSLVASYFPTAATRLLNSLYSCSIPFPGEIGKETFPLFQPAGIPHSYIVGRTEGAKTRDNAASFQGLRKCWY